MRLATADPLDVVIVDDEYVQLESLRVTVRRLGHRIVGAFSDVREALSFSLSYRRPHVVLCDVFFAEDAAGYDVYNQLVGEPHVDTVLVTGADAAALLSRLPHDVAAAALLKPVRERALYLRLEAIAQRLGSLAGGPPRAAGLEVRWRGRRRTVPYHGIIALESSGNDVVVHAREGQRYVVRGPLYRVLESVGGGRFARIHRSYAINRRHVESFDSRTVTVAELGELPLGRAYGKAFAEGMRGA